MNLKQLNEQLSKLNEEDSRVYNVQLEIQVSDNINNIELEEMLEELINSAGSGEDLVVNYINAERQV